MKRWLSCPNWFGSSFLLKTMVVGLALVDLAAVGALRGPAAWAILPEAEKSCCKSSNCTGAVHLTLDDGEWTDGCTKDAAGVCVTTPATSACYRCTGATSPENLCFVHDTGTCLSTQMQGFPSYSCGTKDKYRCKTGGDKPSGCCRSDEKLTPTPDACNGSKCDISNSTPC